jgi:hypothetical protein
MTDRERDRTARNKDRIARMNGPPTKVQMLAEIETEIADVIDLAVAADFPTLVRLLRMAKLEASQIPRRAEDDKDKP